MISHDAFSIEPWSLTESELALDVLAQSESLFTLSNGHIGLRGNLDEGEPSGIPGTYLNSVFERRALPYSEAGYGDPESSETVINVTNGKIFRLLVDDEPFDVRYGSLLSHRRSLDFRAGTLTRSIVWRSPAGSTVKITSVRVVSLSQRSVAAIRYTVEAVDGARVVVQSELVANEWVPAGVDPLAAAALEHPLDGEAHEAVDLRATLVHRTKRSALRVAAAMDHEVVGPHGTATGAESSDDVARMTATTSLEPGERLEITKYLAYGWSSERSRSALHDQVTGALAAARSTGWGGLLAAQRSCLDEFWAGADVEIEGDAEVQQAVRFGLFHVLQAAYRAEGRSIAAKGLTGPGYDGHAFWDTETFVLPVLIYTHPRAARDALEWRRSTLALAAARAGQLGLEGVTFPWRTIDGRECSGYWPAGTAAFHVNADISHAVARYLDATDDGEFERDAAIEILVGTARLWRSLGHHDADGNFRIDGVTGPDEYSAVADNNVYTNLMAAKNLLAAADLVTRHGDLAQQFGVSADEAASWRDAAEKIFIPYDERLGVHAQSEGFTKHARWDFQGTPSAHYPLFRHAPYFDIYRRQVLKQPDLVLAMHLCGERFSDEEKVKNFVYYEALTVRDSSLSAGTSAVLAAEIGARELAYDYLGEAALLDLEDTEHDTRNGLHLASFAGAWTAIVEGFAGVRARDGELWFAPRLPDEITRVRFALRYRGRRISVTVGNDVATYELREGEPTTIRHHGKPLTIDRDPVDMPLPAPTPVPVVTQPYGRAPAHRHRSVAG